MLPTRTTSRLIVALLLLDLALALLYIGNYFLTIPSGTYRRLVDIDGEDSIANWYSSIKLFSIAALFSIFALRHWSGGSPNSRLLGLFPVIFLLLSLDEAVQIHEWLGRKSDVFLPGGDRAGTVFHVTGIWMFAIGLPFFALFLALVRSTLGFFLPHPGVLRRLVLGISIFSAGAIGVEILTNWASDTESLGFLIEVSAEELLEMWGATVMFWAVHNLLESSGFSFRLEPAR